MALIVTWEVYVLIDIYKKLLGYSYYVVNGISCRNLVPLNETMGLYEIGFFRSDVPHIVYLSMNRKNKCPCSECVEIVKTAEKMSESGITIKVFYSDGGISIVSAYK